MKLIEQIDAKILSHLTKFSHWFQRLTGLSNYILAKICLMLSSVSMFLLAISHWFPKLQMGNSSFFAFLAPIYFLADLLMMSNLDKAHSGLQASGSMAKNRYIAWLASDPPTRIFYITAGAYLVGEQYFFRSRLFFPLFGSSFFLFYGFARYFAAVDPLPPGTSKVRQWLTSIRMAFSRPVRAESS